MSRILDRRLRSISARWCTIALMGIAMGLPSTGAGQAKPFRINSISFPLVASWYLDDSPPWTPIPVVIQQLKALGVDDVKIVVTADGYRSPTDNLPDPSLAWSPPEDKIIAFIQQLKSAGLQVTLVPAVNIAFDPNGNLLDTTHSQPTDFNVWIAAHATSMVHWAQIAQQTGVDRLVVMTDADQPTTYNANNAAGWLSLIAQVRGAFKGPLTTILYANGAIFSGGRNHIDLTPRSIIDAIDIIGVGWFPQPLTNVSDPTMPQLLAAWRGNVNGVDSVAFLKGLHDKYNKPVYISDIAFHSFSGDNMHSNYIFDVRIPLVADQQEQANEYDSFLTVMSQNAGDWLLGISFDNWNRFPLDFTNTARFLNSAYGENIRGKQAEAVLTRWFNGLHPVSVVEYYNAPLDHYFMAASVDDIAALDAGLFPGWARTSQSFNAYATPGAGLSPVCRFYIPPVHGDSHFFSARPTDCASLLAWAAEPVRFPNFSGYIEERAAAFYVTLPDATGACPVGTAPVFRLWNQRFDSNHRYTTSTAIVDQMKARNYVVEGAQPNLATMCAPI